MVNIDQNIYNFSDSNIYISFRSDYSQNYAGFQAEYEITSYPDTGKLCPPTNL